tara:strand:+ start:33 stop:719 length:687 start_codon:yes stop_codon:yes gene_type:complete
MLITLKFLKWEPLRNVKLWLRPLQVFVILMLQGCLVFAQRKVIVIDPGHGGKDSGAIGVNYLQEKKVVLNIAMEILSLNKTIFENRFDIYLTRYTDTLISLSDRTKLAKALNADVFISLHCNHANNSSAKGVEVYVPNSNSRFTDGAIELGLAVLNESTINLGLKNRGDKIANFQVLRESNPYYPAVLFEMGFVTNKNEADYFLKTNNRSAMALVILMGLYNFLNTES